HLIACSNLDVIPYEQNVLPSASLGWKAGGQIATQENDPTGTKTKESYFLVKAKLIKPKGIGKNILYHGKRGEIRIALASESIAKQIYKSIKQMFQKRYHL
ncbi:peptidase M50, partial [bacterium]|nr:peptidase M50 [bacterium]